MAEKFSAVVENFVATSQLRMTVLIQSSVQDVIDQAQLSDDKGGKMRVDTGFLRASGQISFSGLPQGPSNPLDGQEYNWSNKDVVLQLSKLQPGQTIYFGWTANYAKYREAYDKFLDSAVQNWQDIVAKNTRKIKDRIR